MHLRGGNHAFMQSPKFAKPNKSIETIVDMRICLTANTAWYVYNFRATTIEALIEEGHCVIVIAPESEFFDKLTALGCTVISVYIDSSGKNIFNDLKSCLNFYSILKKERPDVFLSFTPKCNIFGGLAARVMSIPRIANVSGVGSQFNSRRLLHQLLLFLYKIALKDAKVVFFQNNDDLHYFANAKIVQRDRAQRLIGSGVDIDRFKYMSLPTDKDVTRFLFVGRLLRDKGIEYFVDVAREMKFKYSGKLQFSIIGIQATGNPNAVPTEMLDAWRREKFVTVLEPTNNIEHELAYYDCVVLPSFYGEGMPKSLLEAAACGRPIITTDIPGCRDTILPNETGFLIKPRSLESLSEAIEKFRCLTKSQRAKMGEMARLHAEKNFSDKKNIEKYLIAIDELT